MKIHNKNASGKMQKNSKLKETVSEELVEIWVKL
jgi:hypothetical protein